jgi:hypothetical protein
MKKLLLFPFTFLLLAQAPPPAATPTVINILSQLTKCPSAQPSAIMWNGSQYICATLGPGISLNGNSLLLSAIPQTSIQGTWSVETLPLTNVAAGSTATGYVPAHTPITGVVLYWYGSINVFENFSGAIAWTGSPINVTLPAGWATTDIITFSYQWQ